MGQKKKRVQTGEKKRKKKNTEKEEDKAKDEEDVDHCLLRLFEPHDELVAALHSGSPLFAVGSDDLETILSYILAPQVMSSICAANRRLCKKAWNEDAWAGTIVNSTSIQPAGRLAFSHFRLWGRALAILNSQWQWRCVNLLLSKQYSFWRWCLPTSDPFFAIGDKLLLISARSVCAPVLMHIHLQNLRGPVHLAFTTRLNLGAMVAWSKGRTRKGIFGACLLPSDQVIASVVGFATMSSTTITFGNNAWDLPAIAAAGFVVLVFSHQPDGCVTPCWTPA